MNFSVSSLFTSIFGVASPLIRRYRMAEEDLGTADARYKLFLTPVAKDDEQFDSNLGTPVQFPMAFQAGTYNTMNKGVIEQVQVDGMKLPYASVASFSRAKRFTETYMSGHKGSVIEQYGFEPWQIRIQGLIIRDNDYKVQSVADQVQELLKYADLCDAIQVKGKVFEWYKISHVAIIDISFPASRDLDMNVVKPYEMTLKSVEPIELILP